MMAFQKSHPVDSVQRMISSIRHFEKKLDKLQDDMKCQSQTLSELRLLVLNLSAGHIVSPDSKAEDANKRSSKRTMAIQHDNTPNNLQNTSKMQKSSLNQPVPKKSKILTQNQKCRRLCTLDTPYEARVRKAERNQIHLQRHKKADATRKAKTVRTQKKISEKKLSKLSKEVPSQLIKQFAKVTK